MHHTIPLNYPSFILYFIRQHWIGLILIFITSILTIASSTTFIPLIISYIVDTLNGINHQKDAFSVLTIPLMIFIFILGALEIISRIKGYLFGIVYPRLVINIVHRLNIRNR